MSIVIRGTLLLLFLAVYGCGLQYIDAPPLGPEDRWVRQGFSKRQVLEFYKARCGGDVKEWSYQKAVEIDNCMLGSGFIFIDSPYGTARALCRKDRNEDFMSLPSCQSLRARSNK